MKLLLNQKLWAWIGMFAFLAFVAFAPEAAIAGKADIKGLTGDSVFKDVITLAFGIFAFVKWIDFFANFSPDGALRGLLVPAVITFLAFKWTMVLGWFKLV